jgi:hypothetical protein
MMSSSSTGTSDYLRLWGDGRVGRHLENIIASMSSGGSSMRGSGQARWMAPARPQPWPCTSTGEPISWQNSTMCISIPRPPPSPLRFHSGTSGALSGMTSLFQSYGEHFWAACSCARFTSISPGAFPTSMSFPLSLLSLQYPPILDRVRARGSQLRGWNWSSAPTARADQRCVGPAASGGVFCKHDERPAGMRPGIIVVGIFFHDCFVCKKIKLFGPSRRIIYQERGENILYQ